MLENSGRNGPAEYGNQLHLPWVRCERLLRSLGWRERDGVMLVAESDPSWEQVSSAIRAKDVDVLMVERKYTRRELDAAEWLDLTLCQIGYSQPEDDFDDFAYSAVTYDEVCFECGSKGEQCAPFRMSGEPRWGGTLAPPPGRSIRTIQRSCDHSASRESKHRGGLALAPVACAQG